MVRNELAPVLVDIRGGEVRVQELGRMEGGPAIDPGKRFFQLGFVEQAKVEGERGFVTVWRWVSPRGGGHEKTKAAAVTALLASVGYEQVKLTATIPDLLASLI